MTHPIARHARWPLAALLIAALPWPIAVQAAPPAEPAGLWAGPMLGDTPATLEGATVIDVDGLDQLLATQRPLLIDVGPADHKPDGLPPGTVWKPSHRSLPDAVWMPGAGRADLPTAQIAALLARVGELTHGRRDAPIVVFCKPRCWGSWNAAKRLVGAGYTAVHWFPAGVHGWQERHDTVALQPEAGWRKDSPP